MTLNRNFQNLQLDLGIADQFSSKISPEELRQAAIAALRAAGLADQPVGLSIEIAEDGEVQRLNREYRGVDRTTDVLSFANEEAPDWRGRPGVVYNLDLPPADADELVDDAGQEWAAEFDDEADDGPGGASATFQAPSLPAFVLPPGFNSQSGGQRYLGDIIISFQQAERQAPEFNNDPRREVQELVIHGIFHLLGFDHEEAAERELMRANEEAAARLLEQSLSQ